MRTRWADGPDALALLDAAWDRCLTAEGHTASACLSAAWLRAIADEPDPLGQTLIVRVDDARGEMVAGAAFLVRAAGVGPARVRLGTWLGNHPRRVFSPVIVGGRASPRVAERVLDVALGRVDGLVLRDSPPDLVDGWASIAPWASRLASEPTWVLSPLQPGLGRRVREVNYDRRRAERRGVVVTAELATEPREVAAALEVLLALHQRRWAGRRDPSGRRDVSGFSRSKGYRALHRRALPAAAASGQGAVALVREDGRLTAAASSLRVGTAGVLYRTAMAELGQMRGPGVAAQTIALAALEDAGVRRVELGMGANDYKRRLGCSETATAGLAVAASRRWQRPLELSLAAHARLSR
jgi:CelD/BcsL family acetyltransferase involved in cellulose biosynthesis